ncbi:hypothetical protein D770_22810 [Flammeovirgaceae bacterium 311]|nr:hypothetical protein D770_22810 [Flammeovirgaceae bacterium 311]
MTISKNLMFKLKNKEYFSSFTPALKVGQESRIIWIDCLFLGSILLLLQAFIIWGLGFYSDDWHFLAVFHNASDKSISSLIYNFFVQDLNVRMRPVQIVNMVFLYKLFGTNPLGYHVVNSLFILSAVILLYVSLILMKLPRFIAIGIAVIYAFLPHFSTDRIWMATFHTNLSISFFFLNFIAIVQSLKTKGKNSWYWLLVSLLSVMLSILAYEVVIPLFLVVYAVFLWKGNKRFSFSFKALNKKTNLVILFNIVVFSLCVLFKAWISVRTGGFYTSYKQHLWYVFTSVIKNDFITYGFKLPVVIWKIFRNYYNGLLLAVGLPLGILIFLYIQRLFLILFKPQDWLKIILAGIVVYWAGYAIFSTTAAFMVHPTGISNRIAMAASIGVATCFLGAIGFTSSLLPSFRVKKYFFSAAIACLGTFGFMINYTIATFFHRAYPIELEIIADLQKNVPVLSGNSVLILDGICPYVGPALVFETSWDVTGMLRIAYNLKQVSGNIRTYTFKYNQKGITTIIYGQETFYPFNENLLLYNYLTKQKVVLANFAAADAYFKNTEFTPDSCPPGTEGSGVAIF